MKAELAYQITQDIKVGDTIAFDFNGIDCKMKILKMTDKYFWSDYTGGLRYKRPIRSLHYYYIGICGGKKI